MGHFFVLKLLSVLGVYTYLLVVTFRICVKRSVRWTEHAAHTGEMRNAYNRILVGKTAGRRPLGGTRRRWEDNIRMDLTKIGWKVVE
jgi:hypothetical protein